MGGSMAFSQGQGMFDGTGDVCLCKYNGFKEIFTQSEIGRNGRRKCATSAVGIFCFHPAALKSLKFLTVIENVHVTEDFPTFSTEMVISVSSPARRGAE